MAAIDKIYVSNFQDFDDFRKWVMIYYPKMSRYFYNYFMSESEFDKWMEEVYQSRIEKITKTYEKFEGSLGVEKVKEHLFQLYCNESNLFDVSHDAQSIIDDFLDTKRLNKDDFIEKHCHVPITNFPCRCDKILLWRCPIPFVRDYLKKNCGYKTKWYHKLFWKGKGCI
ncbi:MAG: hypothetical protein NC410_09085 [Oscillibacter sp.]|nr:hypothetical protein [Oscillibacter sp.]